MVVMGKPTAVANHTCLQFKLTARVLLDFSGDQRKTVLTAVGYWRQQNKQVFTYQ